MKNEPIREMIQSAAVPYWRVADELGISPSTLSVWLRHELDGVKRQRVEEAVKAAAQRSAGYAAHEDY